MPEAVIVDAIRTPVGRAFKGSLAGLRPDDTGAYVVDQLLERNPDLDPAEVEEVMCGCGMPQGLQAFNIGRIIVLLSEKLPETVNGVTISRYCASSLEAIRQAANSVATGQGDAYIAAGVEWVSRYNERTEPAGAADQNERLQGKDGQPNAYIEMGVTAGNSCPLNDGAAATLIMSADRAKQFGLQPRARIVTAATFGNEPEYMGVAPIGAIKKVLDRAGMSIGDVETVELNEAFAAQVIPIMDECDISLEKLNTHGGAIALGHPFGMTGARIMTTLLNVMETDDHQVGLETMCVAGGQGEAMIVERLS
jgi:acetyl-CoA C-acetyltransferase